MTSNLSFVATLESPNMDQDDRAQSEPFKMIVDREYSSFGQENASMMKTFFDKQGRLIQPSESLLLSTRLTVSDFKSWIVQAWNVRESEVKKPNASTGGRVWMGVVYRLDKMIIIRKYKMDFEEYWMVTYVGPILPNPPETKRRKIEYVHQHTNSSILAANPPVLPSSLGKHGYEQLMNEDSRPTAQICVSRIVQPPVKIEPRNSLGPPFATTSFGLDVSRSQPGVVGSVYSPTLKGSTDSWAPDCLGSDDAVSLLLTLGCATASASEVPLSVVDSVVAMRQEAVTSITAPSVTHSVLLETLRDKNDQIIPPQEGLLLSAKLKVGDFKLWIAQAWGVVPSEVRKAPACTGGRVWMAMVERLDRMIIVRKYRIDPEEYWMVTYVGIITMEAAEVRRSKIEHIHHSSVNNTTNSNNNNNNSNTHFSDNRSGAAAPSGVKENHPDEVERGPNDYDDDVDDDDDVARQPEEVEEKEDVGTYPNNTYCERDEA